MNLDKPRLHILPLIIGSIAFVIFVAIMLYGLISGRAGLDSKPVPLLKSDTALKTAPDGLHIRPEPHRDITVFNVFNEQQEDKTEDINLLDNLQEPNIDLSKTTQKRDTTKQLSQDEYQAENNISRTTAEELDTKPAVKPKAKPAPASASKAIPKGFFIQLAAFADENSAFNNWKSLQKQHHDLLGAQKHYIQQWTNTKNNKIFHRLLLGPFASRDSAVQLCRKLKTIKQNCFVRKIS